MGTVIIYLFLALFACFLLIKSKEKLNIFWFSSKIIFGMIFLFAGYLAFKDIYLVENLITSILALVFTLKINLVEKIFKVLEMFLDLIAERSF